MYCICTVTVGTYSQLLPRLEICNNLQDGKELPMDRLRDQVVSSLLDRGVPQSRIRAAMSRGVDPDDDAIVNLSIKFYFTLKYENSTTDVPGLVSKRLLF